MTGVLYGTTNVLVGHPFDTIKTKMQVQSGMMAVDSKSKGPSYIETIKKVYKTENGLRGFYKGWFPPLCEALFSDHYNSLSTKHSILLQKSILKLTSTFQCQVEFSIE